MKQKVLHILATVTQDPRVLKKLDLRLYDLRILDSLSTIELIVALNKALNIEIKAITVDTKEWSTPAKLVANMIKRVNTQV